MFLSSDPATKVPTGDDTDSDYDDSFQEHKPFAQQASGFGALSIHTKSTADQLYQYSMPSGWLEEVHSGPSPNRSPPIKHEGVGGIHESLGQTGLGVFLWSRPEDQGSFEPYTSAPNLASSLDTISTDQNITHNVNDTVSDSQRDRGDSNGTEFTPSSFGGFPGLRPSSDFPWQSYNNHVLLSEEDESQAQTVGGRGYAQRASENDLDRRPSSSSFPQVTKFAPYRSHNHPQWAGPPHPLSLETNAEQPGSPDSDIAFGNHSPDYSHYRAERNRTPGESNEDNTSPYEVQVSRFRDAAFHGALKQVQPELSREQHYYAREQVRALSNAGEQNNTGEHVEHKSPQICPCGCTGGHCTCHPMYCDCLGCDHTQEATQLAVEAQRKWHADNAQDGNCGCGGQQQKCSCLPGLCACTNYDEHETVHERAQEPLSSSTAGPSCLCPAGKCGCSDRPDHVGQHHSSHSLSDSMVSHEILEHAPQPPDPAQAPDWDRDSLSADNGTFTVQRNLIWGINSDSIRRFEQEVLRKRPDMSHQERNEALLLFHLRERQLESANTARGRTRLSRLSIPGPAWMTFPDTLDDQTSPPACCCSNGAPCVCYHGSCTCGGKDVSIAASTSESRIDASMQPSGAARPLMSYPSRFPQPNRPLNIMVDSNADQSNRQEHLTLPEPRVKESYNSQSQTRTAVSSSHQPPQDSIRRPDTPRPRPESGASTPYSHQVLQEYVRQSVEPDLPRPKWQRESTPAYEDRSATPSPFSRHEADVEMRDVSGGLAEIPGARQASLPPSMLPLAHSRSHSPHKPTIPPVPMSSSPLKQPKRGDRRKSAVHGAKIGKRSVTAGAAAKSIPSRPKSRNVTRKPTASVGKLVERANKMDEEAAASAQDHTAGDLGRRKPTGGGKVAVVIERIEQQVRDHAETSVKQKDGTSVRRSRRVNKGVRTSLG